MKKLIIVCISFVFALFGNGVLAQSDSSIKSNKSLLSYNEVDLSGVEGALKYQLFNVYGNESNKLIIDKSVVWNKSQQNGDAENGMRRETTSLTVGYISNEFNLHSDEGTFDFRYNGELMGLRLGGESSSLTLSYGMADAENDDGDIRSIAADLSIGGNAYVFRSFLGLPVGGFIPIRFNFGYRGLNLLDVDEDEKTNSVNLGTGDVGAGFGAKVRLPTGLPLLEDNITAHFSLVRSFGGMIDFSSPDQYQVQGNDDVVFEGVRLTDNTDFNIEAKFENLLGNTGATIGMTLRWLNWTDNKAENFFDILDVATGNRDDLKLRATQTFVRLGINW